jgi:hypothetical protein
MIAEKLEAPAAIVVKRLRQIVIYREGCRRIGRGALEQPPDVHSRVRGWLPCTGVGCYGAFLAGWLGQTKQHFQNCWLDEAERLACGG